MIARRLFLVTLAAGLLAVPAFVPTIGAATKRQTARKADQKPKGATAQCDDGTYSRAKTQQGACSTHGGVKTWFGESAASTPTATPPSTPAPSTSRAATPARRSGTAASAAPKDATARCNDGSYATAPSREGACAGHGGVAEWYK